MVRDAISSPLCEQGHLERAKMEGARVSDINGNEASSRRQIGHVSATDINDLRSLSQKPSLKSKPSHPQAPHASSQRELKAVSLRLLAGLHELHEIHERHQPRPLALA